MLAVKGDLFGVVHEFASAGPGQGRGRSTYCPLARAEREYDIELAEGFFGFVSLIWLVMVHPYFLDYKRENDNKTRKVLPLRSMA